MRREADGIAPAADVPDVGKALGKTEARTLTDKVKDDAETLWTNLRRLYDGGAHTALGYSSWGDYFEAEFGKSRSYGYRLLKAAEVAGALQMESPARFSRQIGDSLGLTEGQARELAKADDPQAVLAEASGGGRPTAKRIKAVVAKNTAAAREVDAEVVEEQLAFSFTVEAEPTEGERWKAAAQDAGYSLAEWTRATLNAACT